MAAGGVVAGRERAAGEATSWHTSQAGSQLSLRLSKPRCREQPRRPQEWPGVIKGLWANEFMSLLTHPLTLPAPTSPGHGNEGLNHIMSLPSSESQALQRPHYTQGAVGGGFQEEVAFQGDFEGCGRVH